MHLSDIIRIPFGYLLDWLYQFTSNYGIALILFSLIVKVVMLPLNAKSKQSMLKMARVAPMQKALEAKYAGDQAKYQQEVMKLYKEEGVSTTGGCLWSFIPLLILLPLYYVIREPITYMLHYPAEVSAQIVEFIGTKVQLSGRTFYHQLEAAQYLGQFKEAILAAVPSLDSLRELNFNFLGINLAEVPDWHFWNLKDWNAIGLFLLPVLSGLSNVLSMWVGQKMNATVTTDQNGEKDKEAAKANQTMNSMMFTMPLISVWIGFSMPASITVYWIAQAIFSLVIDYFLTIHYRKVYAEEDEVRRTKAAEIRKIEEEKERIRAERRAANPDGINENVSKKKQERKEREAYEASVREYAEKNGLITNTPADPEKCPSGIPERPYCRGRNYDPDRYRRKNDRKAADEASE